MEQFGDYMSQVSRQYDRKLQAYWLRQLRDLIRKNRVYEMAKKLHKDIDPTLFDPAACRSAGQELDRMHKESEQALGEILERLDNSELVREIQKRLAISDQELAALTISDGDVERLINSPLLYRKNNAETTPKRPG